MHCQRKGFLIPALCLYITVSSQPVTQAPFPSGSLVPLLEQAERQQFEIARPFVPPPPVVPLPPPAFTLPPLTLPTISLPPLAPVTPVVLPQIWPLVTPEPQRSRPLRQDEDEESTTSSTTTTTTKISTTSFIAPKKKVKFPRLYILDVAGNVLDEKLIMVDPPKGARGEVVSLSNSVKASARRTRELAWNCLHSAAASRFSQ